MPFQKGFELLTYPTTCQIQEIAKHINKFSSLCQKVWNHTHIRVPRIIKYFSNRVICLFVSIKISSLLTYLVKTNLLDKMTFFQVQLTLDVLKYFRKITNVGQKRRL